MLLPTHGPDTGWELNRQLKKDIEIESPTCPQEFSSPEARELDFLSMILIRSLVYTIAHHSERKQPQKLTSE